MEKDGPPYLGLTQKEKNLLWSVSIANWKKTGRMSEFMVIELGNLRDREGDPLSDEVLECLFSLMSGATRATLKKADVEAEAAMIRGEYKWHLVLEKYSDPEMRPQGASPSDLVMAKIAKKHKKSVSVIDQIVHPRGSRKPRKT